MQSMKHRRARKGLYEGWICAADPRGLKARTARTGLLLCLPALLGLGVCYLLPFGMALFGSLREGLTGRFCGLNNYLALWGNSAFRLAAKNTLLFWCAALPLNLALGLGLALLCGWVRIWGGNENAKGVLFLPAMIPAACVAIIFEALWRLLPGPGLVLAGRGGAAAILFLYLWKNVGYTVLLYSMALQSIPQELLDAARQDGAGEAQLLWYIKLPLTLPVSGICLIVALLGSFRIFRESYLLAGPHPDTTLYGLQHFLYNNFANMNYPRLAAASVLLTGLLLLAAWLMLRRAAKRGWLPDEAQG